MPVFHGLWHAMVISITVFIRSVGFPTKGLLPSAFPDTLCAVAEVQPLHALPASQSPAASTAGWRQRSVKLWAEFYITDSGSAVKRFVTAPTGRVKLNYGWSLGPVPLSDILLQSVKGGALCLCPSHSLQTPVICCSFSICVTEINQFAYHCRALGYGWVESTPRASPHLAPAVTSQLPEGA